LKANRKEFRLKLLTGFILSAATIVGTLLLNKKFSFDSEYYFVPALALGAGGGLAYVAFDSANTVNNNSTSRYGEEIYKVNERLAEIGY
jgi:purine nucleoside permease